MVRAAKAGGHLWTIHGVSESVSSSATPPTREEIIRGYMLIPILTPTHRNQSGVWQYTEQRLTREEAEAKADKLLGPKVVPDVKSEAAD